MKISVLIPTHNPRADYLGRTLAALRAQTLTRSSWELLLIDNCSSPALSPDLVGWHPHGRVVPAPVLGLTHARLAGFAATQAGILVWADDDNLLEADYLQIVLDVFSNSPRLGAAGGKSIPEYETPPPSWYRPDLAPIGCRDLGDRQMEACWNPSQERLYPDCAPIGAGLAIRKDAMSSWVRAVQNNSLRQQLGRTGAALTSGEDNDINLTLLSDGWMLAYLPNLRLTHLIPARRLTIDYQQRIAHAAYRDFVRVLAIHGIRPWPAIQPHTVRLRQLKAWFTFRAWSGPAARILWHGSCGQIQGRAAISAIKPASYSTR